jgi:hypothetical protein
MLATGGLVDTGKPVAMSEGRKRPTPPVVINQLSGTFKKGGQVKKYKDGDLVTPASKSATVVRERQTVAAPTAAERAAMQRQIEDQRATENENRGYKNFKENILLRKKGGAC